jgi:hypothetical protein
MNIMVLIQTGVLDLLLPPIFTHFYRTLLVIHILDLFLLFLGFLLFGFSSSGSHSLFKYLLCHGVDFGQEELKSHWFLNNFDFFTFDSGDFPFPCDVLSDSEITETTTQSQPVIVVSIFLNHCWCN